MNDKGVSSPETIIIQTPIVHAPNHRASSYEKQKLMELQGEIDESRIIVGD